MGDVVNLSGEPGVMQDGVNTELVGKLEQLLERAKSGSVISLAYTIVRSDKTVGMGWHNAPGTDPFIGHGLLGLSNWYAMEATKG